jgi:hypothetical protein
LVFDRLEVDLQPMAVARLSVANAAYLAGLIDGEGTIALTRRHVRENRQLVVTISSTERVLVDWVLHAIRAGKITTKKPAASHHAPGLTYVIANRQALAMLEQVTPFLKSYKVLRARLVLDHYLEVTPRNGKYDLKTREARLEFERKFAATSIRRVAPKDGRVGPHNR